MCDSYAFTGWTKPRTTNPRGYQIEHVLEWQLVVQFFTWINDKRIRGPRFRNPYSDAATKDLNFCGYWKETWFGTGSDSSKFSIGDSQERNVRQHLQSAYPGTNNFLEEFVWLETTINSPGKQYVSVSRV